MTVTDDDTARRRGSPWWRCDGEVVPTRATWPVSLRRVLAYGLLIIVIWFVILAWWSTDLAGHFSLTFDYSFYGQAWYLIAHGHLDPYSSVGMEPYWHNAFESVVWPLAPLWYLWPHTVTLLWAQDAATAGCFAVIFIWMCELVAVGMARGRLKEWSIALPVCGVLLLVASPWPIWINSFDFHPEAFDLLFVLLAARAFWKGQSRRGWIWVVVTLLCGALGATYVAGLGLSMVFAGRRWRRLGPVLLVVGVVWLVVLSHIGADHASGIYTNLTRGTRLRHPSTNALVRLILEHPSRATSAIWSVRTDLYADVASGGIIGFFSPWAVGISLLVLLEGALTGQGTFIAPFVQNSLPVVVLVPLGTVMIAVALAASRRAWTQALGALLAALAIVNVIGWAHDWTRSAKQHYLVVPTASALALRHTLEQIPSKDEVVVSQGVAGPFAFRQWIYVLFKGPKDTFPIRTHTVWFVITPDVGIETESNLSADAQILQLIDHFHARLVVASEGVFVFQWRPTTRSAAIAFSKSPLVPAWLLPDSFSFTRPAGPPSTWHVVSHHSADVIDNDFWTLKNGHYTATVRYSSNRPVTAQLWDVSTDAMVGQSELPATSGVVVTRSFHGHFTNRSRLTYSAGSGLFQVQAGGAPPGDILELRVLSPGPSPVSVYALGVSNTR